MANPDDITLPRFVRPIGVTGLGIGTDHSRVPHTEPFSGVLATAVPAVGGHRAALSPLTLGPLIARALAGGTETSSPLDPTESANSDPVEQAAPTDPLQRDGRRSGPQTAEAGVPDETGPDEPRVREVITGTTDGERSDELDARGTSTRESSERPADGSTDVVRRLGQDAIEGDDGVADPTGGIRRLDPRLSATDAAQPDQRGDRPGERDRTGDRSRSDDPDRPPMRSLDADSTPDEDAETASDGSRTDPGDIGRAHGPDTAADRRSPARSDTSATPPSTGERSPARSGSTSNRGDRSGAAGLDPASAAGPAWSRPDTETATPSLSVRPPGPTRVGDAGSARGRTDGSAHAQPTPGAALAVDSRSDRAAGQTDLAHPSDAGGSGGPTLVVAPAGGSEDGSTTARHESGGRRGQSQRASDASAGQDHPSASRDADTPAGSTADDRASREGPATARTLLNDDGTVDERVFDRVYEKLTRTLERDRRLEGR